MHTQKGKRKSQRRHITAKKEGVSRKKVWGHLESEADLNLIWTNLQAYFQFSSAQRLWLFTHEIYTHDFKMVHLKGEKIVSSLRK